MEKKSYLSDSQCGKAVGVKRASQNISETTDLTGIFPHRQL